MSEQVVKLIDELAKRLTIPFDKALEIAEKQLKYYLVMDIFWIVLCSLIIIFTIWFCIESYKQSKVRKGFIYDIMYSDADFFIPLLVLAFFISVIIIIFNINAILQILINPDYAIIKTIVDMVK